MMKSQEVEQTLPPGGSVHGYGTGKGGPLMASQICKHRQKPDELLIPI